MNDRLDRIQDWLDGLLSEEEEGALAGELLTEPGGAALVEEFAWVHAHLPEALGASGPDPGLLADRVVQEIEARQGERVRDRVLERLHAPARPGTTRIRPISRPDLRAVRSAAPRRAPAGWAA
ncbi:MAG TPA: hypothetical protein VNO22_18295, partial [Planctomycetota bacterium]|nr:hypothetical protein [Planctomycetota bacterium]